MVKIIKRGLIPEERIHYVTCRHCRSELSFNEGEANRTSDQRDGDFFTIKCPVCGRSVTKDATK